METGETHIRPTGRNILYRFPFLLLVAALASAPLLFKAELFHSPALMDSLSGWLTTPYLFFLTNCIILAIVAISTLEHNFNRTGDENYKRKEINIEEKDVHGHEAPVSEEIILEAGAGAGASPTMDEMCTKLPSCSETRASVVMCKKRSVYADDKMLTSARVTSRRSKGNKMSLREGSKSLKVSHVHKAREETLESVWKKITEGRHPPLNRHLRSTSEGIGSTGNKLPEASAIKPEPSEESELHMVLARRGSGAGAGAGSRRQSSASQDELNKRVEAFIAKFKHDMSLQKQDSLVSYMEMINRGVI